MATELITPQGSHSSSSHRRQSIDLESGSGSASSSLQRQTLLGETNDSSSGSPLSTSSSSSSLVASSSSSTRGRPIAASELDAIPLDDAGVDAVFPRDTLVGRVLTHLNCGIQELRLLFMVLPCLTIVLFVTHQFIAGLLLVALTIGMMMLISYRLMRLIRAQRAFYARLSPEGGAHSLGEMRLFANSANPTAMRLAMLDRDFTPNDYDMLNQLDEEHRRTQFTGVPQSSIDRLPTYPQPELKSPSNGGKVKEDTCSVCLEPKQPGEMVRSLACLHSMHVTCIDPWLKTSKQCPVCRRDVLSGLL